MLAKTGSRVCTEAVAHLLDELGDEASMAQTMVAARKLDRLTEHLKPVRFAMLRNITLEPAFPAALTVRCAQAGLRAALHIGEFDNAEAEVLDAAGAMYAPDVDIIVIALRLQSIAPRLVLEFASLSDETIVELSRAILSRIARLVHAIRDRSSATVLVHNFEQPPCPAYGILDAQMMNGQRRTIGALNERLAGSVSHLPGVYIVDLERLSAELGYERAIDHRYWHLARAPYTFQYQQRIAREYARFASALKGGSKKCIVLDCDNTLWGGVVGEEGLGGIALGPSAPGSAFVELHAALLDLYHRGILLALASKNNEADVLEVFRTHPATLLKPAHFVSKRINWRDKATNLREIAMELNIGIDALVFVDDSPFECQLVREKAPEVTVVELPEDPSRFAGLLRSLPYFDTLTLSSEDRRRSEMYRATAAREELRVASGSIESYLRSLEMELRIRRADGFSIPRIAQLTQKTNQFNLTTRRYSEGQIAKLASDSEWRIYCAEVQDKFDNAGIVAVAIVRDQGSTAEIDSFLMSCRVIGRGIEIALMSAILNGCSQRGISKVYGDYVKTAKNQLAGPFLGDCGFVQDQESPDGRWSFEPDRNVVSMPEWFRTIATDEREPARSDIA